MRAEGTSSTVRNQVDTQNALRVLNSLVDLAGRDPKSFGDQLEVVDQGFH